MRKGFLLIGLVSLCMVAATMAWPEESHVNMAQRFGGDKAVWSIDGNTPFVVYYPVSVVISGKVTIPAGQTSEAAGHYLPKPFRGAPVVQATVYYRSADIEYKALPAIMVRAISTQAILLTVTRPDPSDLSQPCDVSYFLELTGEY
jgi:hypothetical protein